MTLEPGENSVSLRVGVLPLQSQVVRGTGGELDHGGRARQDGIGLPGHAKTSKRHQSPPVPRSPVYCDPIPELGFVGSGGKERLDWLCAQGGLRSPPRVPQRLWIDTDRFLAPWACAELQFFQSQFKKKK